MGWLATIGYGCLIAILGGCGVPPVLLILPAGAAWPFPVAFPLTFLGGLGASLLGFSLSRYAFRDTITDRIPDRIARYEHHLESHAFGTVLVLRLLFFLFPPINWMLGLSRIPFNRFVTATSVGILPWTLVYLLTGQGLIALLTYLPPLQRILLAIATLLALLLLRQWSIRED